MTYQRFEDLPVWKAAIDLALRVYALTEHAAFRESGDLSDQLRRSALSVSSNIAEGYERGTTSELLTFLYIARGSAGEARSQLQFCLRRPRFSNPQPDPANLKSETSNPQSEISNLKFEISSLIQLAENCSRQIRGWADTLQNSDIPGRRRLTDHTRDAFATKRRADAFLEKLNKLNAHLHAPSPHPPHSEI